MSNVMNNEKKIFIKMVKTLKRPERWLDLFNEEYNVSQFLDICNEYKVIVILHDVYSKYLPNAIVKKLAEQKASFIEESGCGARIKRDSNYLINCN
jgi:hypothetical protein